MGKLLWKPSADRVERANMTRFTAFVNERHGLSLGPYAELYDWSVENIADFWAAVWDFAGVVCSRRFERVVDDLGRFPGARWFEGARLNFAENLLRRRDDGTAFVCRGEARGARRVSYGELHEGVARLGAALRELGVKPGDRVAAYMPNIAETAVAMLAATSVGATWASCGADLGPQAVLDRLGQIEPVVLFAADGYRYKGKTFDTLSGAAQVARGIPSLRAVVVVRNLGDGAAAGDIPGAVAYDELTARQEGAAARFEQLPPDHPVFIMFSSGTTGKPKCMVQGAGGVLVNHLKELVLHTDLGRDDVIFYITGCSWMMWNWLLSSLAVGAAVVLYDGSPGHPDDGAMWRMAQEEGITVFGCSASYLHHLRGQGARPGAGHDLSALREISQTGSPLSAEGFEYVYEAVKRDLHVNSIAGGTDINGCFVAGSPTLPVYAGEIQARALGMKVKAYDEKGEPVTDVQGELVCEAPAPSMPLGFWGDPSGEKYRDAYFAYYPGRNVWRHADYVVLHGDTGGVTMHGRSDAVLKPSGVRIGTAEIYNVVDTIPGIADSLAIGQGWEGEQRVVLFVKLAPGAALTEELKGVISRSLREKASPRHVPALIVEAPDIPYTFNMKKVESAVTNILNGRPVTNRDALVNPESLDFFERILPALR